MDHREAFHQGSMCADFATNSTPLDSTSKHTKRDGMPRERRGRVSNALSARHSLLIEAAWSDIRRTIGIAGIR